MMKTEEDILNDIYHLVKQSELASVVNGSVSKDVRLDCSDAEDIVISVLTDVPFGTQIQEAYINVNIYVADLKRGNQYVKNAIRLHELSEISYTTLERSIGKDFRISLASQKSFEVKGKNEHFINNKVLYQFCKE